MNKKYLAFATLAILALVLGACNKPTAGNSAEPTPVSPAEMQATADAQSTQAFGIMTQTAEVAPTAIPESSPTPLPTVTPAPTNIDYGVTCWPEDINVKLVGTDGIGLRDYIQAKSTADGKMYRISRALLNDLIITNDGVVFFEGRPEEANGADHTFVYAINTTAEGDFVYQNGTFYFQKKSDKCPLDDEAMKAVIDRILMQKWESRRVDNEGAGLEGFKLTARFYDTSTSEKTFDLEHSYTQITTYTLNGLNTCSDLTTPRRTDYQGEQFGDYKNFYFGGPNCRSMAIGTFQADAAFTQSGYMIRLYKGAMDNQMVKNDGTVASYMFPTSWSASMISDWLATNFPGVQIMDPENIFSTQ